MNKKFVYTVATLLLGLALAYVLATSEPQRSALTSERELRSVRVMIASAGNEHLQVLSQGSVQPRAQTELIPEVSGRIEWMSPALVDGGSFTEGDVLLRIDRADYESALQRAQAQYERAQVEFEYNQDELVRLEAIQARNLASQSQLDGARRAARVAKANLSDSEAALAQARRDLDRTELVAPFDGLVRSEQVDMGQFISRGNSIGTIYATDYVEVRLPVAADQLSYLGLDIAQRGALPVQNRPEVTLSAQFGQNQRIWTGELVRTAAEIDERSRMVYGVARIDLSGAGDAAAIPVGLFVQAVIQGRLVEDVIRLPRSAMRDNDQVLVVDEDDRLRFRKVTVLRLEHDDVLIKQGLTDGERVCISAIQTVVDGMRVKPLLQ